MKYQATGHAMIFAMRISMTISVESNFRMFGMEAPNTFLIPISLMRCSVLNVARPNNPSDAMKMASPLKTRNN